MDNTFISWTAVSKNNSLHPHIEWKKLLAKVLFVRCRDNYKLRDPSRTLTVKGLRGSKRLKRQIQCNEFKPWDPVGTSNRAPKVQSRRCPLGQEETPPTPYPSKSLLIKIPKEPPGLSDAKSFLITEISESMFEVICLLTVRLWRLSLTCTENCDDLQRTHLQLV